MTLSELFETIRSHYVDELMAVLKSHDTVIAEPVMLDSSGNPATDGPYDLPTRLDVVSVKDEKSQEVIRVDTESMISFGAISLTWENDLEVTLEPFQWNWLQLRAQGSSLDSEPIIRWFQEWFKVSKESGSSELIEVVHFLSDPVIENDSLNCEIDLGSAPIDAIFGLLDAVVECGADNVYIGQNAA